MTFPGRPMAFRWDLATGLVSVIAAALAILPLVGFLLAWHMRADLPGFTRLVTIPGLLALAACEGYLVARSPLLFNRFASGLVGGAVATVAFDLVRAPAMWLAHWAPDFTPVIGQHLVGETIGIAPSVQAMALGYAYQYVLIGALAGAAYSLLLGRGRWYWATACAGLAALAYISLPQFRLFVVAEGFTAQPAAAVYLTAFLLAGTVLGLVVQRLGRTNANALYVVFLREDRVEVPEFASTWRG